MPNYYYKAVTRDGEPDEGQLQGDSVSAVIATLQQNGLIPLLATEVAAAKPRRERLPARASGRRLRHKAPDILAFSRSLAALVHASVPLDRALQIMHEVEVQPANAALVRDVQAAIRSGQTLSAALGAQGKLFSPFYISMVRAAEAGGTLGDGLSRVSEYLDKSRALRQKIASALTYPAILGAVAGLSVLLLLMFVVPQFRAIFDDMGSALPLPTRVTLALSDFVRDWGWLLFAALLATGAGVRLLLQKESVRLRLDRRAFRLAVIGPLLQAVATARFARSLGTLLQSGVPMLRALAIARETAGNRQIAAAIDGADDAVRHGGSLSQALQDAAALPPLALQLLKVGEETGAVDRMLLRIAATYDDDIEVQTKRLLALVEPVLIIGLGVLIAAIIMSVLLGIISINELPG